MKYLIQELEKIKKDEDSFLGCDGGNINAETWFCGVEFGSDIKGMSDYYNEIVKDKDKIPYREDCGKFKNSDFDRRLTIMYLKLFTEMENKHIINPTNIDEYLINKLYNQKSHGFKLNLFPIAKPDISFSKEINELLGFSKKEYYDLFKNRVLFFKRIIKQHKPKNIICFSLQNHEQYFIKAFSSSDENYTFYWKEIKTSLGNLFNIKVIKNDKLKVIILPFLGRGNISSYQDVLSISEYLKKII